MELQQHAAFAPLYVRKRESDPNGNSPDEPPVPRRNKQEA